MARRRCSRRRRLRRAPSSPDRRRAQSRGGRPGQAVRRAALHRLLHAPEVGGRGQERARAMRSSSRSAPGDPGPDRARQPEHPGGLPPLPGTGERQKGLPRVLLQHSRRRPLDPTISSATRRSASIRPSPPRCTINRSPIRDLSYQLAMDALGQLTTLEMQGGCIGLLFAKPDQPECDVSDGYQQQRRHQLGQGIPRCDQGLDFALLAARVTGLQPLSGRRARAPARRGQHFAVVVNRNMPGWQRCDHRDCVSCARGDRPMVPRSTVVRPFQPVDAISGRCRRSPTVGRRRASPHDSMAASGLGRQGGPEDGAVSEIALHADLAAVRLHDLFAYVEPEPGATSGAPGTRKSARTSAAAHSERCRAPVSLTSKRTAPSRGRGTQLDPAAAWRVAERVR